MVRPRRPLPEPGGERPKGKLWHRSACTAFGPAVVETGLPTSLGDRYGKAKKGQPPLVVADEVPDRPSHAEEIVEFDADDVFEQVGRPMSRIADQSSPRGGWPWLSPRLIDLGREGFEGVGMIERLLRDVVERERVLDVVPVG